MSTPTEPAVDVVANGVPNGAANGSANGSNTDTDTRPRPPRTPSMSGLSLTEYSANPSPPSEAKRSRFKSVVPEEFILPNGHPDVR